MRPDPKKRIETNTPQSPLGALGQAFGDLSLPNLPTAETPKPAPEPLWKLGRVVLRKETAHRAGKAVIVVDDFATHLPLSVIEATAKKLRTACGCGGAVKDRRIELQSRDPARIRAILEADGFEVAGVR